MKTTFLTTALILLFALRTIAQEATASPEDARTTNGRLAVKLLELQRIWSPEKHCMATDLVHFRDHWLCRFQDSVHLVGERKISVIGSADGKSWKLVTKLVGNRKCSPFSVRQNEEVMLCSAAEGGDVTAKDRPIAWSSRDGINWTEGTSDIADDRLLSRMVWYQNNWLGVCQDSRTQVKGRMSLVSSSDGRTFKELVPELLQGNGYYGPSIVFTKKDAAFCLVAHSRTPDDPRLFTVLGSAEPPYRNWTWKELDMVLVGPTMIQLPDGGLMVAGRKTDHTTFPGLSQITLWSLEPASGKLTELLVLPSGTDLVTCGSPGLAWHEGHVWISYNSSHELHSKSETVIYLAKVRIAEAADAQKRRTNR